MALDPSDDVLDRAVAELPARPDLTSRVLGGIGVEGKIVERHVYGEGDPSFDLGDELREQTGEGGGAFAVPLGGPSQAAKVAALAAKITGFRLRAE